MSYVSSLNAQQKNNLVDLVDVAIENGITNPYSISAFVSIISKESDLIPRSENGNYSAQRICQIWGWLCSRSKELANNPVALFNATYGGRYGNADNEGYKYRGRGYNQLTFKDNYKYYGNKLGLPLVNEPDLLLNPKVASEVAVEFAKDGFNSLKRKGKLSAYGGAKDINDFSNMLDSVQAFYHVNAGTGKSVDYIKGRKDGTGGMTRALSRVESIYDYVQSALKKKPFVEKKGLKTLPLILLSGLAYLGYKYFKNEK